MNSRSRRIARLRARVAVGATAVFAGSLGAVMAWGRQPDAKATSATTSAPAVTPTSPQVQPGYAAPDYSTPDDPAQDYSAPDSSSQSQDAAPMTTQQS
jgi:hypothetical protein